MKAFLITLLVTGLLGFAGCTISVMALAGKSSRAAATAATAQTPRYIVTVTPRKTPEFMTTAGRLQRSRETNEVHFEGRYVGQHIRLIGQVAKVETGLFGGANVLLHTTNRIYDVHCNKFKDESELGKLRPGDWIVIHGDCIGSALGSPLVSNCELKGVWKTFKQAADGSAAETERLAKERGQTFEDFVE